MDSIAATQWTTVRGTLLLAVSLEPKEIGRRIASARERRGLTQLAFALEANVSPSTITRWEAGKLPPVRELMRIADLLEIDPSELVEDHVDDTSELRELRDHLDRQHDEVVARLSAIEEQLRAAAAARV